MPSCNYRKTVVQGIEVHATENAIIVNYELQASIQGDNGKKVTSDKKDLKKMY